jgi:hypothetical protein
MKTAFILFIVFFFLQSTGFARLDDDIKALCGGNVRLVWCQDAGDGTDAGAEGTNLRLMGFDANDGKGERIILRDLSNYARPLLTPDGSRVVFSNRREQKIHVVGFGGSGLKSLTNGFALAVWRDTLTETDWVYAGSPVSNQTYVVNIRRFRLDKPEITETVWSKTPLDTDNFQLSADGKHACGTFPWPDCGVAALPDREWRKFGDGCWPSLSPDNNLLLWIFDGAHRNLTMIRTATDERWLVNINNAPGMDGFEVYHPRWSSHPLFMVLTGPYKIGGENNRIRGGGKEVEIYLGKFAADYKKIEKWIWVTHNQYADFFPDAWMSAAPTTSKDQSTTSFVEPTESKKACVDAWPVSYERMVFFWQNRSKANAFTDTVSSNSYVCRVEAKGRARYGRHFEMAPSGGAFIADGGAGELLEKSAASRQLAVEALIMAMGGNFNFVGSPLVGDRAKDGRAQARPLHLNSAGKTNLSPIIGYADKTGRWNFVLCQKGEKLVFCLRSEKGGPDYSFEFGALSANKPTHVIISCSSSGVACYLDGEQVYTADNVYGGNWRPGSIVFGNELLPEYAVGRDGTAKGWQGLIENVAFYARWMGVEEARKKFKASTVTLAGRKDIPVLRVKAKLISAPAVPPPSSIAPYRRALLAAHYRVEKIIEGKYAGKEILAARWAILDGRILSREQSREGEKVFLALERFSDHPELEGERLIMDSDRYDLPMYFVIDE